MKKMKWILALTLVMACCLVFAACAKVDEPPVASESESESATQNEAPTQLNLTIDGKDIGEYKIVYAHSPLENKIGSKTGKTIGEDLADYLIGENTAYDFDYQTAVRLQTLIKEKTGKTLELVKDTEGTAGDYEILVGETAGRDQTSALKAAMPFDTYKCKLDGTRYVICGKDWGTTWHAVDAWEKLLTKTLSDGKADLDMKTAGDLSGEYVMKKVGCIGDSITRGSQAVYASGDAVKSWGSATVRDIYYEEYLAYPCVAQRNLWKDYIVHNLGEGGARMSHGPNLWVDCEEYTECMSYSDRDDFGYDLVLIMLGTNDASVSGASKWSANEKKAYLDATRSLMAKIKEGSPDVQFVMMNVPHRCDCGTPLATDAAARDAQFETVQALVGEGENVRLYDMERFTKEHLSDEPEKEGTAGVDPLKLHENYYNIKQGANDTTHFNNNGYYVVGMEMATVMEQILNKGEVTEYLW